MPRRASASRENAECVLDVAGLWRSYGSRSVIQGADLRVFRGEVVCLMGDNGAGKTTLLDTILSRRAPERGSISFLGEPVDSAASRTAFLARCGILGHELGLFGDLTGSENLEFFARAFGLPSAGKERAEELLLRAGLSHRKDDLVRHYSRGMRQKLSICRAVLHRPVALFMDEPLTALDVDGVQFFFDVLAEERKDAACIVVTHDRLPFARVADRFVRLSQGILSPD